MAMSIKRKNFIKGFALAAISCIISVAFYFQTSEGLASSKKIMNNLENTIYLDLQYGRVVIRMLPDVAPRHVERIKHLVREGFYNGLIFHRVIDGFVAQGGDPKGDGTGGSGINISAEFSPKYGHKRGVVSMARASDINSADSQFFIVLQDANYLDNQYTIWGYVVDGMQFVDQIKKGEPSKGGAVKNPDKIIKMSVASDLEKVPGFKKNK
jgi:peptidylprolyl isomerase